VHRTESGLSIVLRARSLGVALLSFSILLVTSCASFVPKSDREPRLLDQPQDYARLGIDPEKVAAWEDGRRATNKEGNFEWWYFDTLLDDGTLVVAWFGDNWPYGLEAPAVSLEVTPPGGKTESWFGSFPGKGRFGKNGADIRIGRDFFKGNLGDYRIFVDPSATKGMGIDLRLRATVPPWRPASGIISAGDSYFAWLAAVPSGEVTGSLTLDGVTRAVRGEGYHDHNWGNTSPAFLMDWWWWGRAKVGGRTVIAAVLHSTESLSGQSAPLLYIGGPDGVEKQAWSESQVRVDFGALVPHPDPAHAGSIASSISFATRDGYRVTFLTTGKPVDSTDLMANQPLWAEALARLLDIRPWYTRFASPITLEVPGASPAGSMGTLEYFEFRAPGPKVAGMAGG